MPIDTRYLDEATRTLWAMLSAETSTERRQVLLVDLLHKVHDPEEFVKQLISRHGSAEPLRTIRELCEMAIHDPEVLHALASNLPALIDALKHPAGTPDNREDLVADCLLELSRRTTAVAMRKTAILDSIPAKFARLRSRLAEIPDVRIVPQSESFADCCEVVVELKGFEEIPRRLAEGIRVHGGQVTEEEVREFIFSEMNRIVDEAVTRGAEPIRRMAWGSDTWFLLYAEADAAVRFALDVLSTTVKESARGAGLKPVAAVNYGSAYIISSGPIDHNSIVAYRITSAHGSVPFCLYVTDATLSRLSDVTLKKRFEKVRVEGLSIDLGRLAVWSELGCPGSLDT